MQLAAFGSPEARRPNPGVAKVPREPPLPGTPRDSLETQVQLWRCHDSWSGDRVGYSPGNWRVPARGGLTSRRAW